MQAADYQKPTYKEVAVQTEAGPLGHAEQDTPLYEAEIAAEVSLHRLYVADVFCPDEYFKASREKQERERQRDRENSKKQ